jgi:hypothetical protein
MTRQRVPGYPTENHRLAVTSEDIADSFQPVIETIDSFPVDPDAERDESRDIERR